MTSSKVTNVFTANVRIYAFLSVAGLGVDAQPSTTGTPFAPRPV
jgi:hypothetical protein